MTSENDFQITDPRMQAAVEELQDLILAHFPTTVFEIGEAEEPDSVYMRAIVDVDDTDEVTERIIDRLTDVQVDENLPLYVVTVRTPERIAADRKRRQESRTRIGLPI